MPVPFTCDSCKQDVGDANNDDSADGFGGVDGGRNPAQKCCLCPRTGGYLIKTTPVKIDHTNLTISNNDGNDNSNNNNKTDDFIEEQQQWVHLSCCLWLGNTIVKRDSSDNTAVADISKVISKINASIECSICGNLGGAQISCLICGKHSHVPCAGTGDFGLHLVPLQVKLN